MSFTIVLPGKFDFSKCRRFSVRGYNKAKISATISAEVKDCLAFNPILVEPNEIVDAVGEPSASGKVQGVCKVIITAVVKTVEMHQVHNCLSTAHKFSYLPWYTL